ncbi:MAG: nucleotidyltransferase domain-containing protein [Spirochaetes bacterium]|nr:MAG: nucleotidyltransferase domain-containing protein [Spirochaetota bacterium]
MPVRSLSSSVLKWPNAKAVDAAVRDWAKTRAATHSGILRIGYFGSYARGDWGVGSDLDVVVVVNETGIPFERRALKYDSTTLPVPADLFVYSVTEWETMRKGAFGARVEKEAVWVFDRAGTVPVVVSP